MTDAMGAGAVEVARLKAAIERAACATQEDYGHRSIDLDDGTVAESTYVRVEYDDLRRILEAATPSPQRADASEMREALKPFAEKNIHPDARGRADDEGEQFFFKYGDLRRARAVYQGSFPDNSATAAASPEVEEPALGGSDMIFAHLDPKALSEARAREIIELCAVAAESEGLMGMNAIGIAAKIRALKPESCDLNADVDYIDPEVRQIMGDNLAALVGVPLVAIADHGGCWIVHQHTRDSVFPRSKYLTARDAAARMLQLLHIGPVRPQTWPEEAEIGSVS